VLPGLDPLAMNEPRPAIDIGSVQEAETLFRRKLRDTPDDLAARIWLAWYLLVHASHEAGAESVLTRLAEHSEQPGDLRAGRVPSDGAATVDGLLRDCLRQLFIVAQLSLSPQQRADAQHLKELVRTCNGEELIRLVEQHATDAQRQLLKAVLDEEPGDADHRFQ
jgi:hypothetical protein